MPQVEIVSERELPSAETSSGFRGFRGWEFDCQILADDGSLHAVTMRLSWADYNLWSPGGSDEPSKVAEAALGFLLTKIKPAEVRAKFDAARVRVQFPDADEKIPAMIE